MFTYFIHDRSAELLVAVSRVTGARGSRLAARGASQSSTGRPWGRKRVNEAYTGLSRITLTSQFHLHDILCDTFIGFAPFGLGANSMANSRGIGTLVRALLRRPSPPCSEQIAPFGVPARPKCGDDKECSGADEGNVVEILVEPVKLSCGGGAREEEIETWSYKPRWFTFGSNDWLTFGSKVWEVWKVHASRAQPRDQRCAPSIAVARTNAPFSPCCRGRGPRREKSTRALWVR